MEFGLSQEQRMLQKSIGGYLEERGGLDRARRFADGGEARATDLWDGLTQLGVPGLLIAEEFGGLGMSLLDAALVAETLGYYVTPVPFTSSVVMAPLAIAAAGSVDQQARWLPALADGSLVMGAALSQEVNSREGAGVKALGETLNGKAFFVIDVEADLFLVADTNGALYVVEANATGLSRRAHATIDKTRRVGELAFANTPAERLAGGTPELLDRLLDAGRVCLAADTLGAAQCMIDQAVAYSKVREQFGRVIGSFQAVKHMCAEMAANLEPCRAMMWYAAFAIDALPDEAPLTALHTKSHLSEVGTFVAKTATEVHGGIGFTDELGLHYWFKRIGLNRQLLGGPERLREEAARLQGLA